MHLLLGQNYVPHVKRMNLMEKQVAQATQVFEHLFWVRGKLPAGYEVIQGMGLSLG